MKKICLRHQEFCKSRRKWWLSQPQSLRKAAACYYHWPQLPLSTFQFHLNLYQVHTINKHNLSEFPPYYNLSRILPRIFISSSAYKPWFYPPPFDAHLKFCVVCCSITDLSGSSRLLLLFFVEEFMPRVWLTEMHWIWQIPFLVVTVSLNFVHMICEQQHSIHQQTKIEEL